MKKTTKMLIVSLMISMVGILFLNIREEKKIESIKRSLKGEIVFPVAKDDLYTLKLPTMELNKIQIKDYKFIFPSYPSWSPDGQRLALSQYRNNAGVLTIVNLIKSHIKELNNINLDCDYISWSPNGEYIAFLGRPKASDKNDYSLYALSLKDMKYKLVADVSSGPYRPTWSPDSSKIAFSSADNRIFIIDSNGDNLNQIISFGASPTWSPDGKFFVYRARYSVCIYDLRNKTEKELISNLGFSDIREFAWSPDGQYILFKKLTESHSPIEIVSLNGKTKIKLQEFGNLRGFSWKY